MRHFILSAALVCCGMGAAQADTPADARAQAHLDDIVAMAGMQLRFQVDAPGAAMVAVSGDHVAMVFDGETAQGDPVDARSLFRVGSLSKVITGHVLAHMADQGVVALDDPITRHLSDWPNPTVDGRGLTLLDLVTQSSGFLRELPDLPYAPGDQDTRQTPQALQQYLASDPLLFAPGTRTHYSNLGFQVLGAALGAAHGGTYPEALAARVTGPLGMVDTGVHVPPAAQDRLAGGHFFDGSPMDHYESGDLVAASGGLFTTPADMQRWLQWNLAAGDNPVRDTMHRAHRLRGDFVSVAGMDESGPMDGVGLAWITMNATPYRPAVVQKSGAHGGYMAYVVLAPEKRAGVFAVMNMFDFDRYETLVGVANGLLADLPGG